LIHKFLLATTALGAVVAAIFAVTPAASASATHPNQALVAPSASFSMTSRGGPANVHASRPVVRLVSATVTSTGVTCAAAEAQWNLRWGKSPYEILAYVYSTVSWCYNSTIVTSSSAAWSGATTKSGDDYKWDFIDMYDYSKSCYVSDGSSFNCSGNKLSEAGDFVQCPGDPEYGSCDDWWLPDFTWRVAWKGYSNSNATNTYTTSVITNG
jgi:hypothetical protein